MIIDLNCVGAVHTKAAAQKAVSLGQMRRRTQGPPVLLQPRLLSSSLLLLPPWLLIFFPPELVGNSNLLQYSCLEDSMGRGAWQAIVYGITRVRHGLVTRPPSPDWGNGSKFKIRSTVSTEHVSHLHQCKGEKSCLELSYVRSCLYL